MTKHACSLFTLLANTHHCKIIFARTEVRINPQASDWNFFNVSRRKCISTHLITIVISNQRFVLSNVCYISLSIQICIINLFGVFRFNNSTLHKQRIIYFLEHTIDCVNSIFATISIWVIISHFLLHIAHTKSRSLPIWNQLKSTCFTSSRDSLSSDFLWRYCFVALHILHQVSIERWNPKSFISLFYKYGASI